MDLGSQAAAVQPELSPRAAGAEAGARILTWVTASFMNDDIIATAIM